jgi:cytosine/adenosine deaminase-related metal-dependent hydrolase
MPSKTILLKNGTVLVHDVKTNVIPTVTSVLIEDGKIVEVADDIEPSGAVEVVDCTNKIISPGFIDTHHHGWQTQLKGRHANEQLLAYMVTGTRGLTLNTWC